VWMRFQGPTPQGCPQQTTSLRNAWWAQHKDFEKETCKLKESGSISSSPNSNPVPEIHGRRSRSTGRFSNMKVTSV
ncbi:hypothetical protein AJ78_08181, partial [Emergomyces pasteurianus Ep9510]